MENSEVQNIAVNDAFAYETFFINAEFFAYCRFMEEAL